MAYSDAASEFIAALDRLCIPPHTQRVQSTYMVQSMVSVVVICRIVGVSIPHIGT